MHFNVHAHIFTLRTVLSRETIRVMTQRLSDRGVPRMIVEAVEGVLDGLLDRPEVLDERELIARLLNELRRVSGFDRFVERNLARLPFNVVIRGDGLEGLHVDTLQAALDQLTTAMAPEDDLRMRPFDVVAALRLAMRGTITEVAGTLLDQVEPDDSLVALMMDIRAADEPDRDRENFLRQIEGTREASLQHPGRILPFFAVHPGRSDHFELMEDSIQSGAFLGVKLYPSLGYPIDSDELRRVYAFCRDRDVPVLLHCSHGGFYREKQSVDFCDPIHWGPVLKDELAELRVCFAHFGGWDSLGRPGGLGEDTWGGQILRLMRERTQVYSDLAFHTNQMHDPEDEAFYFRTLSELLADGHLGRRILFGTDSWMLRMEMTEGVFWRYYRDRMSADEFAKIAVEGPREFLGFPDEGGAPRANLQRHLDFLVEHRGEVGSTPARWVLELSGEEFEANREPAGWRKRSFPARCTYGVLQRYMTKGQRRGTYATSRTLRLRDLTYFRPRDPNFEGQICLGLALQLVGCCEDGGGRYEASWSRESAVERLREVLRDGSRELVAVARLLDSVFHFEEALV